jgi:hypothetical protein
VVRGETAAAKIDEFDLTSGVGLHHDVLRLWVWVRVRVKEG